MDASETPANNQYDVPATAVGAALTADWSGAGATTVVGADFRQVIGETREDFQYVAGTAGDFTAAATLPGVRLMRVPVLVTLVESQPIAPTNVLVTLGDSITEGAASTANAFLLQGSLCAWEGDKEVCHRDWDRSVPRDFL